MAAALLAQQSTSARVLEYINRFTGLLPCDRRPAHFASHLMAHRISTIQQRSSFHQGRRVRLRFVRRTVLWSCPINLDVPH